jgi:hypothetical protein
MLDTEKEVAILERLIQPEQGVFSREAAKDILKLRFGEQDHARMAELSERAQQGTLTAEERVELDGYINVSHLLAFLQSKARVSLGKRGPDSTAA